MKRIYTEKQLNFLKQHYAHHGGEWCAKRLALSPKRVNGIATKHKLRISAETRSRLSRVKCISAYRPKSDQDYAVNPQQFYHPTTPETAYLLGLLWGDGYVYQKGYTHKVAIFNVQEDSQHFLPIFQTTGRWAVSKIQRKKRKPILQISTSNKPLVAYLIHHGYRAKSSQSADSILATIPEALQRYWFLGLVDADGCFYLNKKNANYQFSVASAYAQAWTYLEHLCKKLDVRYSIIRRIQKRRKKKPTKSSIIRITSIRGIAILAKYLYPNGYELGLDRKYQKARQIMDLHSDDVV